MLLFSLKQGSVDRFVGRQDVPNKLMKLPIHAELFLGCILARLGVKVWLCAAIVNSVA